MAETSGIQSRSDDPGYKKIPQKTRRVNHPLLTLFLKLAIWPLIKSPLIIYCSILKVGRWATVPNLSQSSTALFSKVGLLTTSFCLTRYEKSWTSRSEKDTDCYLSDNKDWFQQAEQIIHQQATPSYTPQRPFPFRGKLSLSQDDRSLNYDQLIKQVIIKPSSNTDALAEWDKIYGNHQGKSNSSSTSFSKISWNTPCGSMNIRRQTKFPPIVV